MTEETKEKFDYAAFMRDVPYATEGVMLPTGIDGLLRSEENKQDISRLQLTAIGSIADSLQRIATAQEMIAQLTNIDLDATIQEGSKILYAEMKAKEMRGETN